MRSHNVCHTIPQWLFLATGLIPPWLNWSAVTYLSVLSVACLKVTVQHLQQHMLTSQ